ncbi:hypothetical protein DH2020_040833 [Rehmannia glutinosa]|uniref:Uncharacterized protein n=1 Tax=Rehmannia glutinosa TaxID=99300 RepID=A0ABR0USG8_REHGL
MEVEKLCSASAVVQRMICFSLLEAAKKFDLFLLFLLSGIVLSDINVLPSPLETVKRFPFGDDLKNTTEPEKENKDACESDDGAEDDDNDNSDGDKDNEDDEYSGDGVDDAYSDDGVEANGDVGVMMTMRMMMMMMTTKVAIVMRMTNDHRREEVKCPSRGFSLVSVRSIQILVS